MWVWEAASWGYDPLFMSHNNILIYTQRSIVRKHDPPHTQEISYIDAKELNTHKYKDKNERITLL